MNNSRESILVAILTNNDDDIYCFRKELIEGLLDDGYEILISCPDGPKFKLLSNLDFIYDDPPIDRRGTNIILDLKLIKHYYNLLRKHKPDVILTYTAKPNIYAGLVARMLNIPVINNLTGLGSIVNQTALKKAFILTLFRVAFRQSSCIMFQNETNMNLAIQSKMVRGNYKLLPGSGVNVNRFPLQAYPIAGDGIEGDNVVFNYIGRVLKDKRIDDYIDAAKIIKKRYPKTTFNIIGFIEPTELHYEKLLHEMSMSGVINYCGSTDNVLPFIAQSHCTIHPSTYGEGMSNVLLESASSGRVIITTDNPGCREVVENEVTGYIYKGEDVDALVALIERFLALKHHERMDMGLRGRERMCKYFSREVVVKEYKDSIKEIIGE